MLAAFVVAAYLVEGNWRALHTHLGYTIVLLVCFRLCWGAWGSQHARFAGFVTGPTTAVQYAFKLMRGNAEPHAGHDPAGAMMIIALITALLVTGLTGLTLYGMEGNGPMARLNLSGLSGAWLEQIHAWAADATMVLACIHVLGVLFSSWRHGENLVLAMWSGRKRKRVDQCR